MADWFTILQTFISHFLKEAKSPNVIDHILLHFDGKSWYFWIQLILWEESNTWFFLTWMWALLWVMRNKLIFQENLIDYTCLQLNVFPKHTFGPIWDTQINALKIKLFCFRILKKNSVIPALQKQKGLYQINSVHRKSWSFAFKRMLFSAQGFTVRML